jgi:hypothetical protein
MNEVMFDWLWREISTIKTPRFHLTDGPADAKLRDAVARSRLPLPSSYQQFVLRFGNARLYRDSSNDSYRIGVFAGPRESTLKDGTRIYQIGFRDGASLYVKSSPNSTELPIFEYEEDSEERVVDSFEEWLRTSCAKARNSFGKSKWAEILRGPKPFTGEEQEIIEARRLIRWTVLGIDREGYHLFEVTNTGRRVLAAITVGVRSKDSRLNGAVRLDVSRIGPGRTAVLRASCYKGLVPPQELEIFAVPDPNPEDREYYWEFEKSLQ